MGHRELSDYPVLVSNESALGLLVHVKPSEEGTIIVLILPKKH